MSERLALIGFVNSEQVIADRIKQQTPDVILDGYVLFPNKAFERTVDNVYRLYEENENETQESELAKIALCDYRAVNLGPDTAVLLLEDRLKNAGARYIGARTDELAFELDKTKIFEIFPDSTDVLPPTRILESHSDEAIHEAINYVGEDAVIKFVGDYTDFYDDSEYRRVRYISEFGDYADLRTFIAHSIESSGKAIIQKRVKGQEFSYTCIVDENYGQFRLGENIFYKRRYDYDQGPLCDGTGSITVGNTLPGILNKEDINFVQTDIVGRYIERMAEITGRPPRTFLNVDLMKDESGKVYLIEVNHRQPGGHTMSNLLAGLETPVSEVLAAAQEDRLADLEPRYKDGASVAVTVFPEISPRDFSENDRKPIVDIPHNLPNDDVRLYTGWVNVLDDNEHSSRVESNLTATIIAVAHEASVDKARNAVYGRISQLALNGSGLTYRSDIGLHVPNLILP